MKISDIGGLLRRAADLGSHVHTIVSLFGALKGHEPPEDAPTAAKGLAGALGSADERAFIGFLQNAEKQRKGVREKLRDYFAWAYPRTPLGKWSFGRFRVFLMGLPHGIGPSPGKKTSVVTTELEGTTTKTTTVEEIPGSISNAPVEFLLWMVSVIESEDDVTVGYQKLQEELRHLNVPTMPDSSRVGQAYDRAITSTQATANELDRQVAVRRRRRGWFDRLINGGF